MPNRIIKESICTSKSIDKLTPEEEIFCYRLIVNADDYGRFDADPVLLRSRLFPRRTDKIKLEQIDKWLHSLAATAEMIVLYTHNNKPYLQFANWEEHQQIRAKKSKFPAPNDEGSVLIAFDINCNQPTANVPVFVFDNDIRIRNRNTSNGKHTYADNVKMTEAEHTKLVEQYGEEATTKMVEILDNYKGASGKTYKSDYKAILNWVVKRYEEERHGRNQKPGTGSPSQQGYGKPATVKWETSLPT